MIIKIVAKKDGDTLKTIYNVSTFKIIGNTLKVTEKQDNENGFTFVQYIYKVKFNPLVSYVVVTE